MYYWGVTPQDINENWTEELLGLMFQKMIVRIHRTKAVPAGALPQSEPGRAPLPPKRKLSANEFFDRQAEWKHFGGKGLVVKHG